MDNLEKNRLWKKIPWPLLGIGLLGIVFLVWGSLPTKPKKIEIQPIKTPVGEEEKFMELLSTLGLGNIKVMITYSDTGRIFLATDEKIETEYEKGQLKTIKEDRQVVRMRQESGETGFVLHERTPTVSGVVVTTSRAISTNNKLMIIEAARALWDLPLGRIVILGKD